MSVAAARRAVLGFAVVAVLLVAAGQQLHGADHGHIPRGHAPGSAVLEDATPAAVVPTVARIRSALDGEPASTAGSSRLGVDGLVAGVVALASVAACWWYLSRPDRRLAAPLQRSWLAPLRAPPSFA
jgi:hypothetical protein